ncbi:hypothetical protein ACSBR2_037041 [Camellia fascicularis]
MSRLVVPLHPLVHCLCSQPLRVARDQNQVQKITRPTRNKLATLQEYEQKLEHARGPEEVINNNVNNRIQLTGDPFTKKQRSVYLFMCMSFFVGFSSLTLFGCWWIRYRESDLKMLSADDKCVKLCDAEKCIRICPKY